MIFKSFETNKINFLINNYYLFYGENEGLKYEIINKNFNSKNIYRYEEKEILDNKNVFFDSIYSKSFFDNQKIIIISRATDKIKDIIEEIVEKKIEDIKIILISNILDKKSKLRNFFEKNKQTICIPFYSDTSQTLNSIAIKFFKEKRISISQEIINYLTERCRGSRQSLNNELAKIENYTINKNKISMEEIMKLINLSENYSASELSDNCLAKNTRKTIAILNENNLSIEDAIVTIRTFLSKTKRLMKIKKEVQHKQNMDQAMADFKPQIFWKDKELIKQQITNWSIEKIEILMTNINKTELLIKKHSPNSINILSDFLINESKKN
jgi:DNA polymerase-3 subunit delta